MTPAELVAAIPLLAWLAVDALACYRATLLITRDSLPLVKRPRDAVLRRWGETWLGELVVCPWCVSMWLAPLVIAARLLAPIPWSLLALVLAYSAVAGILSTAASP